MALSTVALPPQVTLRRAQPNDAPALTALIHASSAYAGEYRPMIARYAVTPGQLEQDFAVLAERAGAVVGFYSLILDEPELDLMFVADSEQGTGLGRALFEHMMAEARGMGMTEIKIISNPPARGFYERMGARLVAMSPPVKHVTWERPILVLTL